MFKLGYGFTQINYKATDSIFGNSTSGFPNAVSSPMVAFGFPISPMFNVEFGYTFASSVTGGTSSYNFNSQTNYLELVSHYSLADNFALLLGAGPAITTTPGSYVSVPASGYVPAYKEEIARSFTDFNLMGGAQYFFTDKLGVKANLNYGIFLKSAYRKSSVSETLSLMYLI